MDRRIFGLENEYGITLSLNGQRRMGPDEIVRFLFRPLQRRSGSSNVFLTNGARLYLDTGAHPEYATPECDNPVDVVTHDKAGERILEGLAIGCETELHHDGTRGKVYLFKNNTDSAGNSYGCHENYLTDRQMDPFKRFDDVLIPFFVSRQIGCGAGKILITPYRSMFSISQRAEHMWESVSSATTRSRPIINTRDEPHADAERYRRLHVIVGDANMSEFATYFKIASTDLLLRCLEDPTFASSFENMTFNKPLQAIRDISHDLTFTTTVSLASGKEMTALEMQEYYFGKIDNYLDLHGRSQTDAMTMEIWAKLLTDIRELDFDSLSQRWDWALKYKLVELKRAREGGVPLSHPKITGLDLQYHDIRRDRSPFYIAQAHGMSERITTDEAIEQAMDQPPQNTRAKLRGDFVRKATEHHKDFTVDWTILKFNYPSDRSVLIKDPFASTDERVKKLMASMDPPEPDVGSSGLSA